MTDEQYRDQISFLESRLSELNDAHSELVARMADVVIECRKYNHPGASPAAHELANLVLELATGERREYR
jgi:hypothetical protein